jgi:hypothetical protein
MSAAAPAALDPVAAGPPPAAPAQPATDVSTRLLPAGDEHDTLEAVLRDSFNINDLSHRPITQADVDASGPPAAVGPALAAAIATALPLTNTANAAFHEEAAKALQKKLGSDAIQRCLLTQIGADTEPLYHLPGAGCLRQGSPK